jgi:hypothetical protein
MHPTVHEQLTQRREGDALYVEIRRRLSWSAFVPPALLAALAAVGFRPIECALVAALLGIRALLAHRATRLRLDAQGLVRPRFGALTQVAERAAIARFVVIRRGDDVHLAVAAHGGELSLASPKIVRASLALEAARILVESLSSRKERAS